MKEEQWLQSNFGVLVVCEHETEVLPWQQRRSAVSESL